MKLLQMLQAKRHPKVAKIAENLCSVTSQTFIYLPSFSVIYFSASKFEITKFWQKVRFRRIWKVAQKGGKSPNLVTLLAAKRQNKWSLGQVDIGSYDWLLQILLACHLRYFLSDHSDDEYVVFASEKCPKIRKNSLELSGPDPINIFQRKFTQR